MKISTLHERGIRELNEDMFVCDKEHLIFGVFDGASPLTKFRTEDGLTGGYLASHVAAESFARVGGGSLKSCAIIANETIEKLHKKYHINTTEARDRFSTSGAVFRISDDSIEIFQIGDSLVMIEYVDGRVEVPLGYNDQDLETMRMWRQLVDVGEKDIRQKLDEQIIKRRNEQNIDYGNLNGDIRAEKHMLHMTLPRSSVKTVIALTDGLFIPKEDPDAQENWSEYMAIYHNAGLDGLFHYVRDLEKSDPELTKYPRFKMHDDATAVAVEW